MWVGTRFSLHPKLFPHRRGATTHWHGKMFIHGSISNHVNSIVIFDTFLMGSNFPPCLHYSFANALEAPTSCGFPYWLLPYPRVTWNLQLNNSFNSRNCKIKPAIFDIIIQQDLTYFKQVCRHLFDPMCACLNSSWMNPTKWCLKFNWIFAALQKVGSALNGWLIRTRIVNSEKWSHDN